MTKAKVIQKLREQAARLDEIAEEKATLDAECKSIKEKSEKLMQKHFSRFCRLRTFPTEASDLEELFDLYEEMAGPDASTDGSQKSGPEGV